MVQRRGLAPWQRTGRSGSVFELLYRGRHLCQPARDPCDVRRRRAAARRARGRRFRGLVVVLSQPRWRGASRL